MLDAIQPVLPRQVLPRQAFWFLRHGETDWNAQNLSQGNVDIPLNAAGLAQARAAALLLEGRGIRSIVASPLSRAQVTAEIVAERLGLPVTIEPGLREVSFGVQEGQPMGDWFDGWVAGHHTPDQAESFANLQARAVAAMGRALQHESAVLVVAHGALFRTLRAVMGHTPSVRTHNAVPILCTPGEPWTLSPL